MKKPIRIKYKNNTGSLIKPDFSSEINEYVVKIVKDTQNQRCIATLTKDGVSSTIEWTYGTAGEVIWGNITGNISDQEDLQRVIDTFTHELSNKQDTLVSGTNIKTINGNTVLGSGDITITGAPTHYLKTLNISGNTMTFRKVVDGTEEDQSYTPNFDDKYIALTGNQTITGIKNFATNLQVGSKNVATEDQVSARELVSNKVSTIAASDTTYPTCNAVIAYINSLNGDNDQF